MSRREARQSGQTAAPDAGQGRDEDDEDQLPDWDGEFVEALVLQGADQRPAVTCTVLSNITDGAWPSSGG